jgi:hypothetical protein
VPPIARRLGALAVALFLSLGSAVEADAVTFFQSPSTNIGCGIDRQGVRCDIRERDWRPPPKPSSCPVVLRTIRLWRGDIKRRETRARAPDRRGEPAVGARRRLGDDRELQNVLIRCEVAVYLADNAGEVAGPPEDRHVELRGVEVEQPAGH